MRTGSVLEYVITGAVVLICAVIIWTRRPDQGFLPYFMDWAGLTGAGSLTLRSGVRIAGSFFENSSYTKSEATNHLYEGLPELAFVSEYADQLKQSAKYVYQVPLHQP